MNDPLNCTEIRALLVLFVGDDLDAAESARVARHLAECGPCRAEQARWMETRARLATLREMTGAPGQAGSASLWSNIRAELVREGRIGSAREAAARSAELEPRVASRNRRALRPSRVPWLTLAAAAAAVVATTLFLLRDGAHSPVLDDPTAPRGHGLDSDAIAEGTSEPAMLLPGAPASQLVHSPLRKAGAGDEALIQRAEWVDGLLMRPQFTTTNPPTLNLAGDELR